MIRWNQIFHEIAKDVLFLYRPLIATYPSSFAIRKNMHQEYLHSGLLQKIRGLTERDSPESVVFPV